MDIKISYLLFSCVLLWTGSDGNSNQTTSPSPTSNFTTAANISDPLPNASSTSSPILSSSTTGNIMEDGAIAPTTEPTSFVNITSSPKPGNQPENSSTEKENTNSTTTNQTSLSKDSSTRRPGSVTTQKPKSTSTLHNQGSSGNRNDDQQPTENSEKKYLWILLPVLCVLLAAAIYLKSRCKKVQHRPEMTDNGTENASFQRTDSNKDGVMLLGVSKTSGGEDNASAI